MGWTVCSNLGVSLGVDPSQTTEKGRHMDTPKAITSDSGMRPAPAALRPTPHPTTIIRTMLYAFAMVAVFIAGCLGLLAMVVLGLRWIF